MISKKSKIYLTGLLCICIAYFFILTNKVCATEGIIQNPDFSQGKSVWITTSWLAGESDVYVENEQLHIYSREYNDVRVNQQLSLEPNSIYRISAKVMLKDLDKEADIGAWIGFDHSFARADIQEGIEDWQEVTFFVDTGENRSDVKLCLSLGDYSNLAKGKIIFDEIQIENAVPQSDEVIYPLQSSIDESVENENDAIAKNALFVADVLCKLLVAVSFMALFFIIWRWFKTSKWVISKSFEWRMAIIILLLGFIVRAIIIAISKGYPNDTQTFAAWSARSVETGLASFYSSDYFCDYPPGMILLLYLSGQFCKLLGITVLQSGIGLFIMFLPIILCDIALCFLVWRYARKHLKKMHAIGILTLMSFHPVLIYDTAIWHQVDAVLMLCMVGVVMLLEKKKMVVAAVIYGVALLMKPQALILGPLFALPYIELLNKSQWKIGVKNILWGIGASLGIVLLFSLPFLGDQPFWPFKIVPNIDSWIESNWLFEKYFNTAVSYPFASVNAFNFYALLGANFVDENQMLGFLSYKNWANLSVVIMIASTALMYFKSIKQKEKKPTLFLLAAFLFAGIFMFGPRMHERYSLPIIAFLPLAYTQLKDQGVFNSWVFYMGGILANISLVLYTLNNSDIFYTEILIAATRIVSAYNLSCFFYLAIICFDICILGKTHIRQEGNYRFSIAKKIKGGSKIESKQR